MWLQHSEKKNYWTIFPNIIHCLHTMKVFHLKKIQDWQWESKQNILNYIMKQPSSKENDAYMEREKNFSTMIFFGRSKQLI